MTRLRPAELLLQELGVEHPDDIDLDAIAFHVGCLVRYRPLDGCEARIVGVGDRAIISISTHVNPLRQRFSLGHELGHWFHHRGKSFICRAEDIANEARSPLDAERVADGYAADLLLPPYLVEPLTSAQPRVALVEGIAKEFRTSIPAAAIRLVEIGRHPLLVVCHGKSGRRWFRRSAQVPQRWFPREDLDADSYAFDVLHSSKTRSHRALMPASAWFDRREADRYELFEESFRLSTGDVLTLLSLKDEEMYEADR